MEKITGKSGLTFTDLTTFVRGLNEMSEGAAGMVRGMESCDLVSTKAGHPLRNKTLIKQMEGIRDEARKAASDGAAEIKDMIAELN